MYSINKYKPTKDIINISLKKRINKNKNRNDRNIRK